MTARKNLFGVNIMGIFSSSKKRDQAIFELMVLSLRGRYRSWSPDFRKGDVLSRNIMSAALHSSEFFQNWPDPYHPRFSTSDMKKWELATKEFNKKEFSKESQVLFLLSDSLLDDYKAAIPKKYREKALRLIVEVWTRSSIYGEPHNRKYLDENIQFLRKIATGFGVDSNDAENYAIRRIARELRKSRERDQERFLEAVLEIPNITKKQAEYMGKAFDYEASRVKAISVDELHKQTPGLSKRTAEAIKRSFE